MNNRAQSKLLTTNDLILAFGVTLGTIVNWRRQGLRCVHVKTRKHMQRPRIRFNPAVVERWAKRHGKEIVVPLASLLERGAVDERDHDDGAAQDVSVARRPLDRKALATYTYS